MFERFSDRARQAVVLAQEESQRLNHSYIGTEHLLLGLVREREGLAALSLTNLGISLPDVRARVEAIIGFGGHAPSGQVPFTPRAKKVLELSRREALQLGHSHIGTEHILLGLVREGQGVAAQALVSLGAELERIRAEVLEIVAAGGADPPVAPPFSAQLDVVRALPARACAFCARDLYEVARAVTNTTGVLLCDECAQVALDTMRAAPAVSAPVEPLPFPPRAFGDVPDEQAIAQIVALFTQWSAAPFERALLDLVEGGARLVSVQQELAARYAGEPPHNLFSVDRIRFVDANVAAVRFRMTVLPHQSFDGRVVRVGERWCISRDTYCAVARLGGAQCPDDDWDDDAS